jgi:hypothetical protein
MNEEFEVRLKTRHCLIISPGFMTRRKILMVIRPAELIGSQFNEVERKHYFSQVNCKFL